MLGESGKIPSLAPPQHPSPHGEDVECSGLTISDPVGL